MTAYLYVFVVNNSLTNLSLSPVNYISTLLCHIEHLDIREETILYITYTHSLYVWRGYFPPSSIPRSLQHSSLYFPCSILPLPSSLIHPPSSIPYALQHSSLYFSTLLLDTRISIAGWLGGWVGWYCMYVRHPIPEAFHCY